MVKKFFLKNWLFIFLAGIIAVLGSLYFVNKTTPGELPEKLLSLSIPAIESYPTSVSPEVDQLKTIISSFPKKMAVYQVSPASFSNEKALQIANYFGFSDQPTLLNEPNLGLIYRWTKKEKFLSLNLRQGSIAYGLDLLSSPQQIKNIPLSIAETEDYAQKVIKELNFIPPTKINLLVKKSFYVKLMGNYFQEVSPNEGRTNLVKIEFEDKLDNKKISGNFSITPLIDFYIGPEEKIVRFDYHPVFGKVDYFNSYPLKTNEEIIENLKMNPRVSYLTITNLNVDEPQSFSPKDYKNLITNLVFNNIELIYYKYDPLQSYLQPVFLITGEAQLVNGQRGTVGLYLPAIKNEYFLKP